MGCPTCGSDLEMLIYKDLGNTLKKMNKDDPKSVAMVVLQINRLASYRANLIGQQMFTDFANRMKNYGR